MITLKQLRHFVAVAELGQVSRACERCHVSQPALTTSLKNLEAAIGAEMFERHANGLRLTLRGEGFLQHAQHVLSTLDLAVDEARAIKGAASGNVRLAITGTVSGYLMPLLMPAIRQQLPDLDVQLVELDRVDIERGLLDGSQDFAIVLVSNLSESPAIARETLVRSPRRLWTAWDHALEDHKPVTLAEVATMDFVMLDMDDHVDTVHRYWSRFGLEPRIVFRSKSIDAVRSLVARNHGVTILSDLVYRQWSHDGGRIWRRTLADTIPSMDVGIAWLRSARPSPQAEALARLIRATVKGLVSEERAAARG